MFLISKAARRIEIRAWRRGYGFLERVDPARLIAMSQTKAVEAFRRAAGRVPFYRDLLKERGIEPKHVTDIVAFRKLVPVLGKREVFGGTPLAELCLDGSIRDLRSVFTSSGYSGVFSIGINTHRNLKDARRSIDAALDHLLKIGDRRTYLVNAVPMGVKIPSSLPVAEVSVRGDMALAAIDRLRPYYDQFVVLSDPHFIKKLVEEGVDRGIDWKGFTVHLVMGGDWFSESLRDYLASLIGADPDRPEETRFIGATMGVAELDLNVFHETGDTIRIRRLACRDPGLRKALFGDVGATPILFHYYPHRTYMELAPAAGGSRELVFTMLSKRMLIPLVRYNSGDAGYLFGYDELCKILSDFGYDDHRPRLHLPLVAVAGRAGRAVTVDGLKLTPEAVREALYDDPDVARAVTGQFWISKEGSKIKVDVQLRPGFEPEDSFLRSLSQKLGRGVAVRLLGHYDYPHQMTVDYERKFRHMD